MVHAYVLVKTSAGKSSGVLESIGAVEPVTTAHVVAGNYDVIAEVDAPEVYDVLRAVSSDLQSLDGVLDTKTYLAMD
ncbi:Lrp/AsnC ligand binding domain-containing protein [Halovivax cerinus]|uniref:Lrp/AsnC ligand binding domain-containing protein n=1 Tax=Halovivax cerinus TaxID=1487865 RepID=A0ABD5NJY7_9EURY|nr:Lrp/AsnC ligand binding domain-containing protein [Halovivax cerinus]